MLNISVIICSHNPRADYLQRVFDGLNNQSLPKSEWELLLIDNASQERLDAAFNMSWHPNARHIFEEKLGLAHARQCGMRESSADLLVFVDDDNILDPNYLAEAVRISQEWPQLGVWGSGATSLEFEVEPSEYLREFCVFLAPREAKVPLWTNVFTCIEATPWGAGLCVRASVAADYCKLWTQSLIKISGRSGNSLLSGEDDEIGYTACSLGLGMGIFPELKLIHLIPELRVSEKYLIRLREGQVTSRCLLNYKWQGVLPVSPLSALGLLNVLKTLLLQRGVRRRISLADLRAAIKARRIIAANISKH